MSAARRLSILTIAVVACVPIMNTGELARVDQVERPAASVALDRITKREASLDGIDRHNGSGHGVTVYVFDGGIDARSSELRGRVRSGFNVPGDTMMVCNAHGTAVAAAIAGTTLGVASAASIVDVKVIDCSGMRGSVSSLVRAAQWTIEDHARHPGPAIANWSLLADSILVLPALDSAIARLRAAGILVIAAAGNLDCDACRLSPANSRLTFVVGASSLVADSSGWRDVRTAGTAWGDCVDLYAPGDSVLLPTLESGKTFVLWRGTSMAAGYVSGAAAVLLERHPTASPDSLAGMLRRAATRDMVDERVAGRGRRGRLLYIGGDGYR